MLCATLDSVIVSMEQVPTIQRKTSRFARFLAPSDLASVTGYHPAPSSQGTTLPGVSIFAQPESSMPDSPSPDALDKVSDAAKTAVSNNNNIATAATTATTTSSNNNNTTSSPAVANNRTSSPADIKPNIRLSESKRRQSSASSPQTPSPPASGVKTATLSGTSVVVTNTSSPPRSSAGSSSPVSLTTGGHTMVSTSVPLSGARTTVDLSDIPVTLNIRQLAKVKRFLATLMQFGNDISSEVGERVHAVILALVSSSISIEEFHQKIQDITHYPLRPFVTPFLKAHLPLLQAELVHFARLTKQTPQQYLRHHEHFVIDPHQQSGDAFEIFQPDSKEGIKRRTPDGRCKENGHYDMDGPSPAKRGLHQPSLASPAPRINGPATGPSHPLHATAGYRAYEDAIYRDRFDRFERLDRVLHRDYPDDRDMEDEWKNIITMLNCILGMVEKTKRAISILQHRNQSDRQDFATVWARRHLDPAGDYDLKKRADLISSHFSAKTAELDRVSEVRRRAEEAVNEVKRQAVVELQKAVSAAESKASELVAAERTKMERLITEARRQAAEEALAAINQQEDTTEQNCWNCGRKANETCSGCNTARYCGAFCQHKDWENHHKVCGSGTLTAQSAGNSSPEAPTGAADKRRSPSPAPPKKPPGGVPTPSESTAAARVL